MASPKLLKVPIVNFVAVQLIVSLIPRRLLLHLPALELLRTLQLLRLEVADVALLSSRRIGSHQIGLERERGFTGGSTDILFPDLMGRKLLSS